MPTYSLSDLPAPPSGRTGWPWTEAGPTWSGEDAPPKVCVVVPSFNQGETIEACLRSILLQGYPALEIIVRDGGSTDPSPEIIERYRPFLDDVSIGPDGGQCAAINSALLHTGATYGTWMNTDDQFSPNAVNRIVSALEANPDHILCCGVAEEIGPDGERIRMYEPNLGTTEELAHWYMEYGFHQPSALFRIDVFQDLKGLDPDLHNFLDVELWLRMRQKGSFMAVPDQVCTVMIHPDAKSTKFIKRQIAEHLAVCTRMKLHQAAEWRLNQFAEEVEQTTLRDLRDVATPDQVLAHYSWKEMLRHVWKRKFGSEP